MNKSMQPQPTYISQLSSPHILEKYDAFFLDMWGTLFDGNSFFKESIHFLQQAQQHNKTIVIVSNASRGSREAEENYYKRGLPDLRPNFHVLTAGEMCKNGIASGKHGTKFIGYEKDIHLPNNATYVHDISLADSVILSAITTPYDEGLEPHQSFLDLCLKHNKPIVCANADVAAYNGKTLYSCAGRLTQHYEAMGGTATYYGKPDVGMFEKANELAGNFDKNKILMVGDFFETDIKGAAQYGIDSCVVLSGMYQRCNTQAPENWLTQQAELYNVMPTYWAHIVQ